MNIQQIKDDLDAGIMVSKPMLKKLATAAVSMQATIDAIDACYELGDEGLIPSYVAMLRRELEEL